MITGHMVMHNEADRFLQSVLEWNSQFYDNLIVVDDHSTDESVRIAEQFGVVTTVEERFTDSESRFRGAALDVAVRVAGDWIVMFDADEYIMAPAGLNLDKVTHGSLSVHIMEAWETHDTNWMIRTDGWWNKNFNPRIYQPRHDTIFEPVDLGCGSLPTWAMRSAKPAEGIEYLHVGYAVPGEAARKHAMYSAIKSNRHSMKHIDSLLLKPKLESYTGNLPEIWMGER